jgi:hypothetical protein
MTDTSPDAGVIQSRVQLERLVAEDELAGRTIAGFAAPSVGLRGVDLDNVTIRQLDLRGADGGEPPRARSCDSRSPDVAVARALWHCATASGCDL